MRIIRIEGARDTPEWQGNKPPMNETVLIRALIVASIAAVVWHTPVSAQGSTDERVVNMEQRLKYLEERVAAQDRAIVDKERQIADLSGQRDAWFNSLEIGGLVEIEGGYERPYEGGSATDIAVATVELGIASEINEWVGGEVVLLYEGEDLGVDAAVLVIGPPSGGWSLTVGQQYLPFGTFESNMISDPLTLDMGETSETALALEFSAGDFEGSIFGFKGDSSPGGSDGIGGFGVALGHGLALGDTEVGLNVSYLNDLGDSDGLQEAIADALGSNEVADRVPGWTAGVILSLGDVTVIGEYLAALDRFQADEVAFADLGAQPSSWTIEAAYNLSLGGKDTTIAASFQQTDQALALGLPRNRSLIGLSVSLMEQVSLAVEWALDNDYGVAAGGNGESANTLTVQLTAEF